MPTLRVVSIAASAGHRWSRSACVEKQRRWVGNGCVRGDNSSGSNRGGDGGGGVVGTDD
jgi:hypothetical protein